MHYIFGGVEWYGATSTPGTDSDTGLTIKCPRQLLKYKFLRLDGYTGVHDYAISIINLQQIIVEDLLDLKITEAEESIIN